MEKTENYYSLLSQWLKYYGFDEIKIHDQAGTDKVFRRSRVEASKFGKVDCYICAKYFTQVPSCSELKTFSGTMFNLAGRHRTGMPLGFGAMLAVFPLIIVENITSEAVACINGYCPKHFAAAEFPSVYDVANDLLYFYPSTPLWGAAYYSNYRKQSYMYFSPKSWAEVSSKSVNK
jgi:hypothetical protein